MNPASKLLIFALLSYIFIIGCNQEKENFSPKYQVCNQRLFACTNGNGQYCLFGFKWGESPYFETVGFNASGPQVSVGTITFSFQEENGLINTHSQNNVRSKSFDKLTPCAKSAIRKAMQAWAGAANLEFEELEENSNSQIKFYTADITQGGIGYPNYFGSPCDQISGNVIISTSIGIKNCQHFYSFAMHEVGHVLGLGHVSSANIMNSKILEYLYTSLQYGDSAGIQTLYGKK